MSRDGKYVHICWGCERPILYRDWVTFTDLRWMFPEQQWFHAGCVTQGA